jgi:hypothetical protein
MFRARGLGNIAAHASPGRGQDIGIADHARYDRQRRGREVLYQAGKLVRRHARHVIVHQNEVENGRLVGRRAQLVQRRDFLDVRLAIQPANLQGGRFAIERMIVSDQDTHAWPDLPERRRHDRLSEMSGLFCII